MNLMDKTQKKSKTPAIFLVGVFAAVVILMFVARMRSGNVRKINTPLNNGIVARLKYNNLLAAADAFNYYAWQMKLLEENAAGFGCKLCYVDEFAEKVMYLRDNRRRLAEMGLNSRRLAEENSTEINWHNKH
jgi:hypothetical protein